MSLLAAIIALALVPSAAAFACTRFPTSSITRIGIARCREKEKGIASPFNIDVSLAAEALQGMLVGGREQQRRTIEAEKAAAEVAKAAEAKLAKETKEDAQRAAAALNEATGAFAGASMSALLEAARAITRGAGKAAQLAQLSLDEHKQAEAARAMTPSDAGVGVGVGVERGVAEGRLEMATRQSVARPSYASMMALVDAYDAAQEAGVNGGALRDAYAQLTKLDRSPHLTGGQQLPAPRRPQPLAEDGALDASETPEEHALEMALRQSVARPGAASSMALAQAIKKAEAAVAEKEAAEARAKEEAEVRAKEAAEARAVKAARPAEQMPDSRVGGTRQAKPRAPHGDVSRASTNDAAAATSPSKAKAKAKGAEGSEAAEVRRRRRRAAEAELAKRRSSARSGADEWSDVVHLSACEWDRTQQSALRSANRC